MTGERTRLIHHDKNSAYIDFRVFELVQVQQAEGLNFSNLNDSRFRGGEGRTMVIANKGIWVGVGQQQDVPKKHLELFFDPRVNQTLVDPRCIHLVSYAAKTIYGMSLLFSDTFNDGSFNATMIRREGGGSNHRMFAVKSEELLFIVANKTSLTAKQGSLKILTNAGIKIDSNWKNSLIEVLQ
jgi:hypothetical protein